MPDELQPNAPLPMFDVRDAPADACSAVWCDQRWLDERRPFCDSHWQQLDVDAAGELERAWQTPPQRAGWYDLLWRATCELARVDGHAYRRLLFDGTTVDSGVE